MTLAVAIAGNTVIFSVANALMFKPLPVTAPQELARVRAGQSQMSWPNYADLGERTDVFAALVAHRRLRVGLTSNDGLPVRLQGEQTSLNYFDTLRVPALLGRTYRPADTRRNLVVLAEPHMASPLWGGPVDQGSNLALNGEPVRDHRDHACRFSRRGAGGLPHRRVVSR